MDTKRDHAHTDPSFWVGLFLGGLLGALIVVLIGTDKGKKLAQKLQDGSLDWLEDTKDALSEKVEQLQEKSEEFVEKGKALEEHIVEQVVVAKDNLSEEAAVRADEALAHIEAIQERGRQRTQELRKRLFKNIPKRSS